MNFQNGSFLDDYEDRKKGRKEEREREREINVVYHCVGVVP